MPPSLFVSSGLYIDSPSWVDLEDLRSLLLGTVGSTAHRFHTHFVPPLRSVQARRFAVGTIATPPDRLRRFDRAGALNTECTPIERALVNCLSQPPAQDPGRDSADVSLDAACQLSCDAYGTCGATTARQECIETCLETFDPLDNGAPRCRPALADAVACLASLSCSELYNRAQQTFIEDDCFITDDTATFECNI